MVAIMPEVGLKDLGKLPTNVDKAMWDFLNLIKHNFKVLKGTKGTEANKGVTFGDLVIQAFAEQVVEVADIDDPSPELAATSSSVDAGDMRRAQGMVWIPRLAPAMKLQTVRL